MMASEDRKENDQNETLAVVTHLDSREVEETPTVVSVGCSLLETTPQVKEVLACGARCVQGKNKKLSDWFTFCSNEPCVAWSVVRRAQEEIAKEQKENKFTLTALIEGTPSFEVHEPRVAMISIKFVLKLVKFDGALAILVLQRLHHLRQRHAFVGMSRFKALETLFFGTAHFGCHLTNQSWASRNHVDEPPISNVYFGPFFVWHCLSNPQQPTFS